DAAPAAAAACRRRCRGAGGAAGGTCEPWRLPGLPVDRVSTAPAAVLLELNAVRRVPLGLVGLIVAALAFGASERDCDSDSGCHFSFSIRVGALEIAPGGLEPPTSAL